MRTYVISFKDHDAASHCLAELDHASPVAVAGISGVLDLAVGRVAFADNLVATCDLRVLERILAAGAFESVERIDTV